MTRTTETFVWDFPGGGWGVLTLAVIAVVLIVVSYRHTLRPLALWPRMMLLSLRVVFAGLLIFSLCAPRMVSEQAPGTTDVRRRIAVLFDESSSVRIQGLKGRTRQEAAVNYWKDHLASLSETCELTCYTFAEQVRRSTDVPVARPASEPVLNTHLFKSVAEASGRLSSEGFEGAIWLTDGIDTSSNSLQTALAAMEQGTTRHAFVPLDAAVPSTAFVEFEKIEAPALVRTGVRVPITLVVGLSGMDPREPLQLTVRDGSNTLHEATLNAAPGQHVSRACNFEVTVAEAGSHRYDATIRQDDRTLASAGWTVQAATKEKMKLLLYQGSLDWGTRFLKSTFDRDTHISLDVRFSPDFLGRHTPDQYKADPVDGPVGPLSGGAADPARINAAPFPNVDQLKKYDAVLLMNLTRVQMTAQMETSLREYLSGGGSVLFMIANPYAAAEYAGTPVEKLLPATFEGIDDALDPRTRNFLTRMQRYHAAVAAGGFQISTLDVPKLTGFRVTGEGRQSPMFSAGSAEGLKDTQAPQFEEFAFIRKAKPGATVLATHPVLTTTNGPRVLMAVQRFGDGRSAVLATDPLWRWKLSLPSDNVSFERFWQNLASWLGAGRLHQPYWDLPSAIVPALRPASVMFRVSPGETVRVEDLTFEAWAGPKVQALTLTRGTSPGDYRTTFEPAPNTTYRLVARKGTEVIAESCIHGGPDPVGQELRNVKPDFELLRKLGGTLHSEVVQVDSDFDWKRWLAPPESGAPQRTERHLWHNGWLFALMLGCFLAELGIRRLFRLV